MDLGAAVPGYGNVGTKIAWVLRDLGLNAVIRDQLTALSPSLLNSSSAPRWREKLAKSRRVDAWGATDGGWGTPGAAGSGPLGLAVVDLGLSAVS